MKHRILIGFAHLLISSVSDFFPNSRANADSDASASCFDQSHAFAERQPTATPSRVVVTDNLPVVVVNPTPRPTALPTPTPQIQIITPTTPVTSLRFSEIKGKIAEAKREMSARPIPTSLTDSFLMTNVVRLAFYDYDTKKIDYLVMTKDAFLKRGATYSISTTYAKTVNVTIIRANGVNTPVTITSQNNKLYLPLLVQYPVVRNGRFIETAYYISIHPGMVTPEVVATGKLYMRNQIGRCARKIA